MPASEPTTEVLSNQLLPMNAVPDGDKLSAVTLFCNGHFRDGAFGASRHSMSADAMNSKSLTSLRRNHSLASALGTSARIASTEAMSFKERSRRSSNKAARPKRTAPAAGRRRIAWLISRAVV